MSNNNRDILRDYFNQMELDKVSDGFTLRVMNKIQCETQQSKETDQRLLKLTIFAITLISLLPIIIFVNIFDKEIISFAHYITQKIALTISTIDVKTMVHSVIIGFGLSLSLIFFFSKLITIGIRKSCIE